MIDPITPRNSRPVTTGGASPPTAGSATAAASGRADEAAAATVAPAAPAPTATARQSLAAALVVLNVAPDEPNLLAAQALVRFGVPLTLGNLSDVRRLVASHFVRLPETVALAKSLGLSVSSPAVLRALDTLLAAPTDPSLLTIAVPVRANTDALADHLERAARVSARSVENKLLQGDFDAARSDLRTYLLRQAQAGDADAEGAVRHLEGQMLVSAAATNGAGPNTGGGALLFAFVAATQSGRAHYVEMSLRANADETDDSDNHSGEPPSAAPPLDERSGAASATLSLPTARLGLVTVRLHLDSAGRLRCQFATPDAAGQRRIENGLNRFEAALVRAGFAHPSVAAAVARPATAAPAPGDDASLLPRAQAAQPLRALDLRA